MPSRVKMQIKMDGIDQMKLTKHAIASFRVAKQLCATTECINAIDFSPNGETLISSDTNEQISFYGSDKGEHLRTINVRKYGVNLVRYTQSPHQFIHTSTKVDHDIRHMNENTVVYLDYFRGHTDCVVSLCMSPTDQKFISGSLDRTLRLWDLRSNECKGVMNLSGRPVATFDPDGKIFAVGINSASIKLYDVRMYENGPFVTYKMKGEENCEWIDLKFAPDGKAIMINTNGSIIRLIDAYDGIQLQTITGRLNSTGANIEASFSPDSQYILSGSTDGSIHIWNADNGVKICEIRRELAEPVRCVRFNPRYMLLATADTAINFWLPTI